ncbi:MAG TPA: LuxR family transcriptional regulator [Xanthobacteraceae bacterium]|nr:LuxR family transcriptional regulator [Xanthobacteraceae bacterium]
MATSLPNEEMLLKAFAIVDNTPDMEMMIAELRDLLDVDHIVYHSSKLGASPSADPYIRLTYPAAWIKRYLQMGYIDIDPVIREGFRRALPFDWSELKIQGAEEVSFLTDALAHGVGPHGLSIPLQSKYGHRALFSISFSRSKDEWTKFVKTSLPALIEIANRIHRRVIYEVFGEDRPHLSLRELECLRWIACGKDTCEIAIILDISAHTARDYLKSARYKLDSVTSAQAVTKAVKLGLLIL